MSNNSLNEEIVSGLMDDLNIPDDKNKITVDVKTIKNTIEDIMHDYNLSTDLSFVNKIATLKFADDKEGSKAENQTLDVIPNELKDAAFLPVNTIADIALRQDIDLLVSQIPEWFTALTVTRDMVCESDIATGKLSRTIKFKNKINNDDVDKNIMSKIEEIEDRLDLHSIIKNHIVFNTLMYGEGPIYCVPYAKVFQDLYKYRLNKADAATMNSVASMFDTSPTLHGYGYTEHAVEVSLKDMVVQEQKALEKSKHANVFTEAEMLEIYPDYKPNKEETNNSREPERDEISTEMDEYIEYVSSNIHYINEDIALPIIEESAHDLYEAYRVKYREDHGKDVDRVKTFFESVVMEDSDEDSIIEKEFLNVKGIYLKVLPGTKLIPIRVDRSIIGYYYVSDMTRPEDTGQRKNSGLGAYTLRTPSVGYDTFSPDRVFCDKLANKIINSFNLKFMKDNTALHTQIVSILEAHRFNESMLRFVFIPAENVINCAINKDGNGKGHSMLEPGLVTARMYMFLKLYSILYQINNSEVRVYNLRMSGMTKDYKSLVQDTMRKFSARRVTVNDIFNYKSSMTKVSGQSELIMPMGTADKPPISFETIPAANTPINNELLENLKNEAINSTPVPSALVQGAMSELDFAKEVELANTRMASYISSLKIDLNRDITKLYQKVLRWESDIDPQIIKNLKFLFKQALRKELEITNDMLSNYNSLVETLLPVFMSKSELSNDEEGENNTRAAREFKKLILAEFIPIDINRFEELADSARQIAIGDTLDTNNPNESLSDDIEASSSEGEPTDDFDFDLS